MPCAVNHEGPVAGGLTGPRDESTLLSGHNVKLPCEQCSFMQELLYARGRLVQSHTWSKCGRQVVYGVRGHSGTSTFHDGASLLGQG